MIKRLIKLFKKEKGEKVKYPIRLETYGVMEYCPTGVHRVDSAYGTVTYIFEDGVRRTFHKWYFGELGIVIH